MTEFKTLYGKRERSTVDLSGETQTEQNHKDACDINKIVAGYKQTGYLEQPNIERGQYIEVDATTFQDAMNIVANAKTAFEELPAKVRARFDEDPGKFMDFCYKPENAKEMIELGLATEFVKERTMTEAIDELSKQIKSEGGSNPPSSPKTSSNDKKQASGGGESN